MHPPLKYLIPGLLAVAISASPVFAKPGGGKGGGANGKGPNKEQKAPAQKSGDKDKGKPGKAVTPGKSVNPGKSVPPGQLRRAGIDPGEAKRLAKQYRFGGFKPLPPGIRKNLLRGKPLPPGLAHQVLPAPYLATLPVYPGYEWRAYGSDLVLVSLATAVVADVLMDALE